MDFIFCEQNISKNVHFMLRGNTRHLWLPAYRKTTNLLMISFVACVFTYYGIAFVAEYIFEGSDLYWEMFITTSSEAPGLIMGYFVFDWLGRIKSMSLFFASLQKLKKLLFALYWKEWSISMRYGT